MATCAALTWGLALRFNASWVQVCFGEGTGWETRFHDLVQKAGWSAGLFLTSSAPYLPFLLLAGVRQNGARQAALIGGMIAVCGLLHLVSTPFAPESCGGKGPFPEIGHLLAAVVATPLAIALRWLTRERPSSS